MSFYKNEFFLKQNSLKASPIFSFFLQRFIILAITNKTTVNIHVWVFAQTCVLMPLG